MKCAGLIFDDSFHYIDHLAPLCAQMQWPLLIRDESMAELCRQFYPGLEVAQSFSTLPPCIVSCQTRDFVNLFVGPLTSWKGRLIWLPHGLSDKGWKAPFFEAFRQEDLLLVYGQRMRDVLGAKGISLPQLSIGNYRWHFWQRHRDFYNKMMDERFGPKRFVLYAPTWEDCEQNGTFFEAFPKLVEALPAHLHLLVKIHPNTEKRYTAKLEYFRGVAESSHNISFLDEFPPIYPLLDRCDAYIGDMSSIGYDYLPFGRPLFFLRKEKSDPKQDPSAFLMQCGKQILLDEIPDLFKDLAMPSLSSLSSYAFDARPWEKVATELQQRVDRWVC